MKNAGILVFAMTAAMGLAGAEVFVATPRGGSSSVGVFENHTDVGTVLHAGAAEFARAKGTYTLAGSGENI